MNALEKEGCIDQSSSLSFSATTTSTSSSNDMTSAPTTESTTSPFDTSTQDDEKSNGDSSPVVWIGKLIGFTVILLVRMLKLRKDNY